MSEILEDIVSEGERLLGIASDQGVPLRLLGGVAVRLKAPDVPASLAREYKDIDFAVTKKGGGAADKLLREAGYEPHVAFNAMHARERGLYYDESNGRQVDLFIEAFRMCHEIPLGKRLEVETQTVPLAELMLTKLQIIEVNEKDIRDTVLLFHGHPIADHDDGAINGAQIAKLCSDDWGLWRTITANVDRCRSHVGDYELSGEDRDRIESRFDELLQRIEDEPKSRGWRRRAKVGDKKIWYELPEEVE
jgi:putative nucleotidyltransferase-like protein